MEGSTSNDDVHATLTQWLIEEADILPTRAATYSTKLISTGVGSISRLSKKMSKNESFLVSIGVDEDDGDEIVGAILRFRNIERAKKLKSKQSGVDKRAPSVPKMSSITSVTTSSSSSSSNDSNDREGGDDKSKDVQFPPSPPSSTSSIPCDFDSAPSSVPSLSKAFSSPHGRPNSTSFSPKKTRSASLANFKFTASASNPDLFNKFSTPVSMKEITEEKDLASPLSSTASTTHDQMDDDITTTSLASLRINIHASPHRSPSHSPLSNQSKSPSKSSHAGENKRLSLKNLSWGSVNSHHSVGHLQAPKDAAEIDAMAKSVMFELTMSIDNRSELECLSALTRLHQYRADDMGFYQDALGREGACKAISVILSLFSASTRICLETVKTISVLCQHTDSSRDSYHVENTEELGGHGTCFSVIRILSSATHVTNAELVEETCRAIGKLALSESNNKVMTNGGCCKSLIDLILQDGEQQNKDGEGKDETNMQPFRPAVVVQAVIALRHLAEREETMTHLLAIQCCEAVVGALSRHQEDEVTTLEILGTIIALGSTSREACAHLGDVGVCAAVLDCVRCDETRAKIFEKALVTIEVLLSVESNLPKLLQASICNTLVVSLQRHAHVENVAINACRVIQLFATNAIIRSKLGSAGVCDIMRNLFSSHMGTPSVMQAVCAAVATLAANHMENKAQLTSAGVCEFVILAIQKYSMGESKKFMGSVLPPGSDLVVWQACWALRMLAAGLEENYSRLQTAHVCEALNASLQRHATCPEPMMQVFRTLITLASQEKHEIVAHMGVTGICKSVVRVMNKNQTDAAVCKLGCQVIVRLGAEPTNLPILLAMKASEAVSGIIMVHASADTHLTEWGCKALYTLCKEDFTNNAKPRTGGEIQAVVWAIQRQGGFVEVAEWSTRVFSALACITANAKKFGGSGGCEAIISLTKTHSRVPSVCEQACRVIHNLAMDENNRAWLGASGGCDIVGTVLHHHSEHASVCTTACLAVGKLACNHEGNSARLRSIGMCEKVLEVLERHVNDESCADSTCYAVFELSKFKENVDIMSELQVCEKVVAAMIAHGEVDAVDKHALQAIQRLSLPEFQKNFMVLSNEDTLQHIVNVLSSQEVTTSCDVSVEGCKVINHLAVTDENKQLLGAAGACRALITMLRIHHTSSELVVAHVAVSCAKLAKNCEENVTRFMDQSSCELFLECLDEHKSSDDTIISVFQCLYYFSSSHAARTLILAHEDIFREIMRCIPRLKQDGRGVFWCLRLLVALAWDSDSRDMAHKTNAYKVLPAAALLLKEDRHVVLASLLAVEALATGYTAEEECFSRLCSSDTCEFLTYTLATYQKDATVSLAVCRLLNICAGKEDDGLTGVTQVLGSLGARTSSSAGGRRKSAWASFKGKFFSSSSSNSGSGSGSSNSKSSGRRGSIFSSISSSSASALSTAQNPLDDHGTQGWKIKHYMRSKLGQGGACASIQKVISTSLTEKNEELVSVACEALLALSFEESNLELLAAAGAVDMLTNALRMYGHTNQSLLTTICHLIACLSGVSKTHVSQFGALGACELLTTALEVFCSSAEASEAGCRAIYHLASSSSTSTAHNIQNQNLFGEAGVALTLKKVLQFHPLNLSVTLSAVSAVYAVQKDNSTNCSKFAAITSPHIFLDLLEEFVNEQEVVKHTLWLLNSVRRHSSNPILVLDENTGEDEYEGEGEECTMLGEGRDSSNGGGGGGVMALSQDRVRAIVGAIQQHCSDERIAEYGCELIASILIWGDRCSKGDSSQLNNLCSLTALDGRIYLLNNSHTQLTNYFDTAGACELVGSVLTQHSTKADISAHALHALGLLLRAQASSAVVTGDQQKAYCEARMSHFGSVEDCETVLKIMIRCSENNTSILKYATFVLSNVLFASAASVESGRDEKLAIIGNAITVKVILGLLATEGSNAGVARFGSLFISRLSVASSSCPALLMSGGASSFLLNALNTHLQIPSVVEHSLNAIHALCQHTSFTSSTSSGSSGEEGWSAGDELGNADVCQALASVFTEYPVTGAAVNEPVAFSLCRAVASLADGNGSNCLKFGKVGACEDVVKQLIHFLNGAYIAIIRDNQSTGGGRGGDNGGDNGGGEGGRAAYCELVAVWSCRAIGCLAKDPSTWPLRASQHVKVTGGGFNENRVTLGDVGACEAIAQVLKNYGEDEEITRWALWAALNLCQEDEGNSDKFRRAGGVRCVQQALEHFRGDDSVQSWSSEILAQLEAFGGSK